MDEIRQQVSRARKRMITEQFLGVVVWTLFGAMLASLIAIVVPKVWFVAAASNQVTWTASWISVGAFVGLTLATAITYWVRKSSMDAAIELDRRFGLKERVSSALTYALSTPLSTRF